MADSRPLRVGVLGCGNIARKKYLPHAATHRGFEIVAVADLRREAAESAAAGFGVPAAYGVDELFAAAEVDCVLNLTIPTAHAETGRRAIAAGKHVFGEKPLGTDREESSALLAEAAAAGLTVGTAPDTFLGAGQQTARRAIDDGLIGEPLHFDARMFARGVEHWHPNPEFFYQPGGGPMFDMGPYYLTALVNLLGPVSTVGCFADKKIPRREITHRDAAGGPGPRHGEGFEIEVPDHFAAILRFASGPTGTLSTSFATRVSFYDRQRPITVYGTEGALRVPDPNQFDLLPILQRVDEDGPRELGAATPTGFERSVGLADMAAALAENREPRCSGALGLHVLDAIVACGESAERAGFVRLGSTAERPAPMPAELPEGMLVGPPATAGAAGAASA
ncbi:Gfo/Idh/MocA family protein [Phycisphaera mikurensis]|uniref:Oxidoreductase n=1 Tax=Phycisphaera mikurensis (strain NBRC 102666 / KCTC 22515 / FYK2301M01) TaxID=1142394 RepID=I0ICZ1_PHYMF|nr:Gfo/Idh/MocA family oxidoreductase [Phycisphaera mikurensis]MBB6442259.1 putative dehydrogenase [Phycisphaera mikurensis]BAM03129.1 hypothetical protein PSMK_09700 [Phycisphaera mikurensis NBRC 102666]